jgi:hypothetical protein
MGGSMREQRRYIDRFNNEDFNDACMKNCLTSDNIEVLFKAECKRGKWIYEFHSERYHPIYFSEMK